MFEKGEESNTDDIETDHHIEELSPVVKRTRKEIGHLDFILPTRKSRKRVAEFPFTYCKEMTESMVNAKSKSQTVSYID